MSIRDFLLLRERDLERATERGTEKENKSSYLLIFFSFIKRERGGESSALQDGRSKENYWNHTAFDTQSIPQFC
jgi:hypothetical protein